MTLKDASHYLNIQPSSVGSRWRNGHLEGEKDDSGKIWVWIDTDDVAPAGGQNAAGATPDTDRFDASALPAKPKAARPLLELVRDDRRNRRSCWLNRKGSNVTSQFGEDGILAEVFRVIELDGEKWCVEFGAWDGKKFSNTFDLVQNKGWNGVLIEGSSEKFKDLQKTYGETPKAICLNRIVGFDAGPNSLDSILASTKIPITFDLLSIDIDGNDYHVWESLTTYAPKVVIIEYNPNIPNDVIFAQVKDLELNHGCSLRAFIELGKAKGYELVCATRANGIFVQKQFFAAFGIRDNSIDAMNRAKGGGRIFQGFDGTLFNVGIEKLNRGARGHRVTHDQFQVIDEDKRKFGDSIAPHLKK
jgi:hypothetical protein